MITYGVLATVVLYLLAKWAFYHRYKKSIVPYEKLDQTLLQKLNPGEDSHE
jgi:hypothetical protein